jgi:hypothetical protein
LHMAKNLSLFQLSSIFSARSLGQATGRLKLELTSSPEKHGVIWFLPRAPHMDRVTGSAKHTPLGISLVWPCGSPYSRREN